MPIMTTFGALMAAEPSLRAISESNGMNAKTTYHVAKLSKLVRAEAAHFYEQRDALFAEFGVTPGPQITLPPDQAPAFQRRLVELCAVPVTLEWNPLRSVDLPHAKASELVDLGPLCELVEPT